MLNRDFHAERPNQKWVTDISYIKTGQGVLYLSVIRDLYDNSIVAYKTGTEQNINLVLSTIRTAKRKEKVTTELQLHSDQGFQYTSQAYYTVLVWIAKRNMPASKVGRLWKFKVSEVDAWVKAGNAAEK